ncbi:MAG: hypothetical protein ACE5IR_25420 [bacterium]
MLKNNLENFRDTRWQIVGAAGCAMKITPKVVCKQHLAETIAIQKQNSQLKKH